MTKSVRKSERRRGKGDTAAERDRRGAAAGVPFYRRPLRSVWLFLLTALFVATPLLPSENAARDGTSVILIALWLVFLLLWLVNGACCGKLEIRFGPLTMGVLVFLLCHSLSALVMAHHGQPRFTFNMLWQWIALGVGFWLTLQVVRRGEESRALVVVALGLAVCLSSHGIYQYFYSLPKTRRVFAENPDAELRKLNINAPPGSIERKHYIDRLESTEPFSTFTLANSLAAMLSPWLLVLIGISATNLANIRGSPVRCFTVLFTVALITGCWMLTKSRASWLATMLGACLLAWHGWRAGWWRLNVKILAGAVGAVLLAAVYGLVTGAVDILVLSESAKSFLYRTEYWRATWAMIRDYPWWGCGPGNFQQYYPAYKLPGASETVSDPHNFMLEIWATAGTLTLIAFVVLSGMCAWRIWRNSRPQSDHDEHAAEPLPTEKPRDPAANGGPAAADESLVRPIYWGGLCGLLIAYFPCGFFAGFVPDLALLLLAPLAALVIAGWAWWGASGDLKTAVLAVAVITLSVNLLAAGGISYGGVASTLWLLVALAIVASGDRHPKWILSARWAWVLAFSVLLLGFTFHRTMYVPVLGMPTLLQEGMQYRQAGRLDAAEAAFLAASDADPYSVDPWLQLADLNHHRWMATEDPVRWDRFQLAVHDMLDRNKHSFKAYRLYGNWSLASYRRHGDSRHLALAADAHQTSVKLYPNSSYGHSLLAWTLHVMGESEEAKQVAEEALRLDQINPHMEQKLALRQIEDALREGGGDEPMDAEQLMEQIRKSQ